MTDTSTVRYRLSILMEAIVITLTLIALRMHIITITCDERYELAQRRDRIREQIAEIGRET